MRIIAGLAKGRNLQSPSDGVRPTSDRAREALFSTLDSEFGSMSDL
ncbi:MAG: RsmD family RNA methyltransferase, partial [Actinomycetota bacterium]